jgi:hypothetical protein
MQEAKAYVNLSFKPRRSFHKACIMYTQSDVVYEGLYMCLNHERILIKFGSRFRGILVQVFFKGHLLVRQFVHKAGCIQLFLVPIVKNIQFLLVS